MQPVIRLAGVWLVAFVVYALVAGVTLWQHSIAPYFVDLAASFLKGQVSIDAPPNWGYDLIYYEQRWFVAQPPLPAILLMPFVALWGVAQTSDVFIGVLIGSLNVVLFEGILRRLDLTGARRTLLTLCFGLGTVHFSASVVGTIWYLGHVVGVTCTLAMILAVFTGRAGLAGILAGLLLLARPSMVPAAVIFAASWWLLPASPRTSRAEGARCFVLFGAGFVPFVLLLLGYNAVRFGLPLDFGYAYLNDAAAIRERREAFGSFSPHFFAENFTIAFLQPITLRFECLLDAACRFIGTTLEGAGVFWTSPALLLVFGAAFQRTRLVALLAVVSVLALLPALFYHNTGAAQFGYRFALDALPFWMLLIALGVRRVPLALLGGLVAISIIVNLWGAAWLINTFASL